LINKNEGRDTSLFARGWVNQSLTPGELAKEIDKGVAYCCQLSGSRRASNFLCSDIISVDIDGTRRIEDVMREPIVERCLTIFYTTPRHTPECHRFRLVFALPRTIESSADMVAASRSLSLRLSGDPASTDAAHLFYGSRGSNPKVFDRAIDASLFDELIEQGRDAGQIVTKRSAITGTTVSRLAIMPHQMIMTAAGRSVEFSQLAIGTAIHCPFHHDVNASAFVVNSRAGVKGLHCAACRQTFWPSGSSFGPYNFFDFDDCVRQVKRYFEEHKDPGPLRELFAEDPIRLGMTDANITITADEYLRLDPIQDGLTLIKSPKGTGKTERLRSVLSKRDDSTLLIGSRLPGMVDSITDTLRLAERLRSVLPKDESTLLIGHRVALIRQSCKRLGLECYLDFDGPLEMQRLGVCLDSLQRLQGSSLKTFKTIIIDESEQVLSHFLSETMERENRDAIFVIFSTLLRRAKRVIALDADLGWLTFETLTKLMSDDALSRRNAAQERKQIRTHIYLNERATKRHIEVFRKDYQLQGDLKRSLADKKRIFITSNSKKRIDAISESVAEEFKGDVRQIKITSDTVDSDPVKAFIENPSEHALSYDLILTSPSLGTGVDIACKQIDVVYGFFDALITTHFDFDQQLARVRHPGAVRVWITPRWFRFDTAVDVIKRDILRDGLYKNLLAGFDEVGRPVYLDDDPFLDMASLIVSQQRASKNELRRHFIKLKRRQGYTVDMVDPDATVWREGQGLARLGKRLSATKRVEALLGAAPLRKSEYEDISGRLSENDEVSEPEKWSFERTRIEKFYREPITRSLIELDDGGKYRRRVIRFEAVLDKMKRARDVKLMTGDLRSALEISGAASLGPHLRFVKRASDVVATICYLLHRTPLMRDGVLTPTTLTMNDLGEFAGAMLAYKPIIENVLDLEVRADVRIKPMTQLNAILKLVGLSCKPLRKKKAKGRMIYPYRLDQASYDRMLRLVDKRRAIDGSRAFYEIHGWDMKELEDEDEALEREHFERLIQAHAEEAGQLGIEVVGKVYEDDDATRIVTSTTAGFLVTSRDRKTDGVEHKWLEA
jgi:Origin of replication binding protein